MWSLWLIFFPGRYELNGTTPGTTSTTLKEQLYPLLPEGRSRELVQETHIILPVHAQVGNAV